MMDDSTLVDRLHGLLERLPAPLVTFAESLARGRDRAEGEGVEFRMTEAQRGEVELILTDLARGLEGKAIRAETPASEHAAALAARVRDLRERKKELDAELVSATDELVRAVGEGATVTAPGFRIRIGTPHLSVKIKDARLLPPAFLTPQPDRRAILAHVQEAAEVPPGTEISETRPTVYFSVRKDDANSAGD